jgi:hydroxypyruvate reductase
MITLILSDVLGNDPAIIASGPTVAGSVTSADALAVIERFGLRHRLPPAVISALSTGSAQADATHVAQDIVEVVGDNAMAVRAVATAVEADRLRPAIIWTERRGEAAELGRAWVTASQEATDDVDVLLGGGEATVTVRGDGVGGRNTEFALAAALELDRRGIDDWIIASLATDGQDALTGVAGAVADGGTIRRAQASGVDPAAALTRNDSLRVFEVAGGLITPGPTGTNVNDVYLAVRQRASTG